MRAQVLVSLPLSMDVIDANLAVSIGDDFLVTLFEVGGFTDKNILSHCFQPHSLRYDYSFLASLSKQTELRRPGLNPAFAGERTDEIYAAWYL
jgi:hypothetical protein